MVNLNSPAIESGALTASDVADARKHSTGQIMAAEACTEVGADTERSASDIMFCAWFWRLFLLAYVAVVVVLC